MYIYRVYIYRCTYLLVYFHLPWVKTDGRLESFWKCGRTPRRIHAAELCGHRICPGQVSGAGPRRASYVGGSCGGGRREIQKSARAAKGGHGSGAARPPLAVPSLPEPASRFTVHLSPTQLHARAASQTETAAARINELLTGRRKTEEVVAVRVGIKSRGCNGLSYTMNYANDEPRRGEEAVEQHGAARPSASPTPLCNRVVPCRVQACASSWSRRR